MLSKNPNVYTTLTHQRLAEPVPLSITLRIPPAKARALERVEKYSIENLLIYERTKTKQQEPTGLTPLSRHTPGIPGYTLGQLIVF